MRSWVCPTLGLVIIGGTPLSVIAALAASPLWLLATVAGYVAAATAPSWVFR